MKLVDVKNSNAPVRIHNDIANGSGNFPVGGSGVEH